MKSVAFEKLGQSELAKRHQELVSNPEIKPGNYVNAILALTKRMDERLF